MQCIELDKNTEEEIAKQFPLPASNSSHSLPRQPRVHHRKRGIGIFTGVGTFAGLAWLYYYAVSVLQSALTQFRP